MMARPSQICQKIVNYNQKIAPRIRDKLFHVIQQNTLLHTRSISLLLMTSEGLQRSRVRRRGGGRLTLIANYIFSKMQLSHSVGDVFDTTGEEDINIGDLLATQDLVWQIPHQDRISRGRLYPIIPTYTHLYQVVPGHTWSYTVIPRLTYF